MRNAALIAIAGFAVACSGGSDSGDGDVLRFTGRTETERNFEARIAVIAEAQPVAFLQLCSEVTGKTPAEAAEALRSEADGIPPGSTPAPGQVADPESLERAAVLVQEHCEQTFAR